MDLGGLQCWYATSISTLVDAPTLLDPSVTSTRMTGTSRSGFSDSGEFIDLLSKSMNSY